MTERFSRRQILLISIIGLVVIFAAMAILSRADLGSPPRSTPPRVIVAPQTSGGQVTMVCRDCADDGMAIILWSEPGDLASGASVAGSAPRNSKATILDEATALGGVWYKVKASNGDTGWVKETFVSRSAPQTSGGQVTLVCQDCADIGMAINLWTEPGDLASGARVAGSAPHNTKATILDQAAGWYKVRASNGATGWLQAEFVKR